MISKWFRVWQKIFWGLIVTFIAIACQDSNPVVDVRVSKKAQTLEIWGNKFFYITSIQQAVIVADSSKGGLLK